jgi:hypothetical protein
MKIETYQKKKSEVEIPIPSFYQNPSSIGTQMIAVLNENTVCSVYQCEARTSVENDSMTDYLKESLVSAFLNWKQIEEIDFLHTYEMALASMRLTPQLINGNDILDK